MVNTQASKNTKSIRCGVCRKKINLTYIECRCGQKYCARHICAYDHDCTYDHKKDQQDKIRKNNPVIIKEKFERI